MATNCVDLLGNSTWLLQVRLWAANQPRLNEAEFMRNAWKRGLEVERRQQQPQPPPSQASPCSPGR